MGAGIAANEFENRMCHGLEQRNSEAGRKWNAECVSVAGCIFGGNEAAFAGDAELEKAARTD